MSRFRTPLIIILILLLSIEGYSAAIPLSRWMTLRSDAREPVKRNSKAIGNAEALDVLFEIMKAELSSNEISILVDMTNMADDSIRNVAI
jgi:hypothetical protein